MIRWMIVVSARYTIINHRAAFDSLGEYWVDIANSLIYLIPPTSFNPNSSDITYSKRLEAFDVQASYNMIKNMIVRRGRPEQLNTDTMEAYGYIMEIAHHTTRELLSIMLNLDITIQSRDMLLFMLNMPITRR
jgi:hypothetical protein